MQHPDDDHEGTGPEFPDIENGPEDDGSPRYLGEWSTREEAEQGLADLQAQLQQYAEGQESWQGEIEQMREQIAQLGQQPPPPPQRQGPPQLQPVNLEDLPDPTTDFERFRQALGQKLWQQQQQAVQYAQYASQQTSSQVDQRQQLNNLWRQFETSYPDIAQHELTVQGAAGVEIQSMMARYPGHNPEALILQDREGFMQRVANRVASALPAAAEEAEPEAPARRSRAAALSPGRRGGGNNGAEPRRPEDSDFIREMRQFRAGSGYY